MSKLIKVKDSVYDELTKRKSGSFSNTITALLTHDVASNKEIIDYDRIESIVEKVISRVSSSY